MNALAVLILPSAQLDAEAIVERIRESEAHFDRMHIVFEHRTPESLPMRRP